MEPSGYDLVARKLLACETERRSGVLRVAGEPGGLIHLADGSVAAIETAGAPGPEMILAHSGRISEADWSVAFAAAATGGKLGPELARRGLMGEGELEAVLRVALADAMFAIAGGRVDECAVEHSRASPLLPLIPPAEPGWLLFETSRRLRVLSSTPGLVRHDQDRVTADPGALAAGMGPARPGREEILALANGRRTPRDLAFVLGRGVYSLSLELSRMHAGGLVTITSRRAIASSVPGAPPPASAQAKGQDGGTDGGAPSGRASDLPRRHQPGRQPRSAPAEIMPPQSSALLRLLRLFPAGDRDPGSQADSGAES